MMKWKKSIGALLIAAALATSLAACGEGTTNSTTSSSKPETISQVGQSAANMTPGEIFSAAKTASTNSSEQDLQAKMTAVIKMSATAKGESASIDMNLGADLTAKADPFKMAMNMDLQMQAMGEKQNQKMDMYMIEEDGKCAVYMGADGQWQKQIIDLEGTEFEQLREQSTRSFNTNDFTEAFQADAEVFENKGIRKINGKDAVVLEGEISADEMMEALKSAGIEEQLSQLGLKLSDIQTKSGIKSVVYYDPQTYMPLQMDIDMTDYFNELIQAMMKSELNSNGASMDIEKYTMSIQIVAYGKDVPDVVLPAAAANAKTVTGLV